MKILSVLSLGLLVLSGCKALPDVHLTESPITVKQSDLDNYWVHKAKEVSFTSTTLKPPKTSGFVKVKYLIDSYGQVLNPTIVESIPKGAWDKIALHSLNAIEYEPSKTNSSNTPVYVNTEFNFGHK